MEKIIMQLTTKSNLFIGDTPSSFEIGGVDLFTKTDYNGFPLIPASSFKGALRRIVRDMMEEKADISEKIAIHYKKYLEKLHRDNQEQLKMLSGNGLEEERIQRMNHRFHQMIEAASAEYLFGIQGFNDSPKLIFYDLEADQTEKPETLYSIDSKNTILHKDNEISSNPRIYKAVRPGVVFQGCIMLHHMEILEIEGIREFVEKAILRFNDGCYRLGNSGSRGYGRVEIDIIGGA